MIKKLAKIKKASLEIKDRGILNFWIEVNYEEGCCQNIGGICLDTYDKKLERRIGSAYGCEIIRQLLLCMNVNDFSEMKDKLIWVYGEGEGFNFAPKGIGRLAVDGEYSPVIFNEIPKQFVNTDD